MRHAWLALLLPFVLVGCGPHDWVARDPEYDRQSVPLGKAEMVDVEVKMGAGKLEMTDGGGKLLDAEFEFTPPLRKPRVRYDDAGSRGRLVIEQVGEFPLRGNTRNNWDLRFSRDVPLHLRIHLGAGENRLDLSRLALRGVEVHMGVGEVELDLSGDYRTSFGVEIHGGVGEAKVRLPRTVGVEATARGGIGGVEARNLRKDGGRWVNEAYGRSPVTVHVDVRGGVGSVELIGE